MTNKILGYVLMALGAVAFALSYSSIRTFLGINLPTAFNDVYIMVVGIALLFIGAFVAFGFRGNSQQNHEVPIYEGTGRHRKVVGIQRMHK